MHFIRVGNLNSEISNFITHIGCCYSHSPHEPSGMRFTVANEQEGLNRLLQKNMSLPASRHAFITTFHRCRHDEAVKMMETL